MKILIYFFALTSVCVNAGFFSTLLGSLTGSASTKNSVSVPALIGPGNGGFGRGGPPIQILAGGGRGPNPSTLGAYNGGFGNGGFSFGGFPQSGYAQGYNGGGPPNLLIKQSSSGFPPGFSGAYSSNSFNSFNGGGVPINSGGYGNGGALQTIKLIHQGGGFNGGSNQIKSSGFSSLSGGYGQSQPQTIKLIHQKSQSGGFNGGGYSGGGFSGSSGTKTVKVISENGLSNGNSYSNGGFSSNVVFPPDVAGGVGAAKTIRIIHEKPYTATSGSYSNGGFANTRQAGTTIKIVKEAPGSSYTSSHNTGDVKTIKVINEAAGHVDGSDSYAGAYSSGSFNNGATKTLHVVKEQGGFVPSPSFGINQGHQAEKTIKIIDETHSTLGDSHQAGGSYSGNSFSGHSGSYATDTSSAYYPDAYNNGVSGSYGNSEQTIKVITENAAHNTDAAITSGAYAGAAYTAGNNGADQTVQIIDEGSTGGSYNDGFSNDYTSTSNSYSGYSNGGSYYSGASSSEGAAITNAYNGNSGYSGSPENVKTIQVIQDNSIDSTSNNAYVSGGTGGYGQQEDIKTIKIINEGSAGDISSGYQNHATSYNNGGTNVKTFQIIHENGITGNSGSSAYSTNGYLNGGDDHVKTLQIVDENSAFIKKK